MIGQTLSTEIAGKLTITSLLPNGDGGQGKVFRTNKPEYLIKQWDPFDPPDDYPAAMKDAEKRYRTFARLRFDREEELGSLPLEFVEAGGRPSYVMKRAKGKEMKEAWQTVSQLSLAKRTVIARSLAEGLSVLHSRMVIHADIKRDNFFYIPSSGVVEILDIDGGGYYGYQSDAEQFAPNARANARYLAPELHTQRSGWPLVWKQPSRRKEPDLWSLAVFIYDLLVLDKEGPFPRQFFRRTDLLTDKVDWPAPAQKIQLTRLAVDERLQGMFADVFCAEHRLSDTFHRPTAAHWASALKAASPSVTPKKGKSQGVTVASPSSGSTSPTRRPAHAVTAAPSMPPAMPTQATASPVRPIVPHRSAAPILSHPVPPPQSAKALMPSRQTVVAVPSSPPPRPTPQTTQSVRAPTLPRLTTGTTLRATAATGRNVPQTRGIVGGLLVVFLVLVIPFIIITGRMTASAPSAFLYPKNGARIDFNGTYALAIRPVPDAEGYQWEFKQNGVVIWESQRDDGQLSSSSYVIPAGTDAHRRFQPGYLEASVRAFIGGKPTAVGTLLLYLEQ